MKVKDKLLIILLATNLLATSGLATYTILSTKHTDKLVNSINIPDVSNSLDRLSTSVDEVTKDENDVAQMVAELNN